MSDIDAAPYQVMPPLSTVEYAELEQSIHVHGVQVPVIVDEDGVIIDGHHRAEIADRLGIPYSTEVKAGLSTAQKRATAFEVNLTRRHLDRSQRRELVAESLKADPHLSDREHARRTGVSHPTVASVRAELEQAGLVESFTTRTGADGVEQPVSKGKEAEAESDEAWLNRRLGELHDMDGRIQIPADLDEAVSLLRQSDDDIRRLYRIARDVRLAVAQNISNQTIRKAYEYRVAVSFQRSQMRHFYELTGTESLEDFAEVAKIEIEMVRECLDPEAVGPFAEDDITTMPLPTEWIEQLMQDLQEFDEELPAAWHEELDHLKAVG